MDCCFSQTHFRTPIYFDNLIPVLHFRNFLPRYDIFECLIPVYRYVLLTHDRRMFLKMATQGKACATTKSCLTSSTWYSYQVPVSSFRRQLVLYVMWYRLPRLAKKVGEGLGIRNHLFERMKLIWIISHSSPIWIK